MMDGLAMAETTPGPLIMVLQFVGFLAAFRDPGGLPPLLAGTLGGLLATWVTFAPCFLWIFLGAPFVERMRGNRALAAALAAITAAVVGVILDLALWFAMHALFGRTTVLDAGPLRLEVPVLSTVDPWALALAVLAGLALFRFRVGTLGVVAGSALAGVALRTVGAAP
jgi:chromate transporter